jgi:hypothetical protein
MTALDDVEGRQPIQGKVAGVLTRRELLINRGSVDGVEVGMRFAVLNRHGIDVKDPDTGELLGSADVVKTVVKIVRIDAPHLSTGRTFRTIPGTPGLMKGLSAMSSFAGTPERVETLDIKGASLKEELDSSESYVKVGDPVVETVGDTYSDDLD